MLDQLQVLRSACAVVWWSQKTSPAPKEHEAIEVHLEPLAQAASKPLEEALWDAVQGALSVRGRRGGDGMPTASRGRARRNLLAGLLRCKVCGYSFCADSASGYFACSGRRNRGACDVALRVRHDEIAERVVAALEAQFLDEARIARVIARAEALVEEALASGGVERGAKEVQAAFLEPPEHRRMRPNHIRRLKSKGWTEVLPCPFRDAVAINSAA